MNTEAQTCDALEQTSQVLVHHTCTFLLFLCLFEHLFLLIPVGKPP